MPRRVPRSEPRKLPETHRPHSPCPLFATRKSIGARFCAAPEWPSQDFESDVRPFLAWLQEALEQQ